MKESDMKNSFWDGFEKRASVAEHAIEAAGLGILARPSIQHLRGKEMSESSAHKHEVAGLGVLAAPSLARLGHAAYTAAKGVVQKAHPKPTPGMFSRAMSSVTKRIY